MSTIQEETNQLNLDDRLKGIAYQFLKLYERWAEDRQVLNKNMVVFEEMLKIFTYQIKEFEKLETKANHQILISAEKAAKHVCSEIGAMVGKSLTKEVNTSTVELKNTVNETTSLLKQYQTEVKNNLFLIIGATIIGAVATSLFVVWLFVPAPKLPLTDDQLNTYYNGQFFNEFWFKLSKKEQNNLKKLAETSDNSHNNNATDNNSSTDNSSD